MSPRTSPSQCLHSYDSRQAHSLGLCMSAGDPIARLVIRKQHQLGRRQYHRMIEVRGRSWLHRVAANAGFLLTPIEGLHRRIQIEDALLIEQRGIGLVHLPVHPQCERLFVLLPESPPQAVLAAELPDAQQLRQYLVSTHPRDGSVAREILGTFNRIVPRISG